MGHLTDKTVGQMIVELIKDNINIEIFTIPNAHTNIRLSKTVDNIRYKQEGRCSVYENTSLICGEEYVICDRIYNLTIMLNNYIKQQQTLNKQDDQIRG